VELKYVGYAYAEMIGASSNRTIVELKFIDADTAVKVFATSNRTIVELKCSCV